MHSPISHMICGVPVTEEIVLCGKDIAYFFLKVTDIHGKLMPIQVNLCWDHRNKLSSAKYEVLIVPRIYNFYT